MLAVETAIVVVSASNGLEVNTRRMFNEAGRRGFARMLVINKLDRENANYRSVLDTLRERYGKGVLPLSCPIGRGE